MKQALKQAVTIAGSSKLLGEGIGVTAERVRMWLHRDNLPAEYVIAIERITGVSRHELRPDIYPKEYQYDRVDRAKR
jgi:DNA-binding transcriptional regulator YdaS (Cro superfamily)